MREVLTIDKLKTMHIAMEDVLVETRLNRSIKFHHVGYAKAKLHGNLVRINSEDPQNE